MMYSAKNPEKCHTCGDRKIHTFLWLRDFESPSACQPVCFDCFGWIMDGTITKCEVCGFFDVMNEWDQPGICYYCEEDVDAYRKEMQLA